MTNVEKVKAATREVGSVILGKQDCVDKIMMTILAGGHVLIEDIPGVGKTTLALAFAKVLGLKQNRIQFTPDVLPSDIVGFNMYSSDMGKFQYHPGVVMCNLLLADEINRTSAKTQSALLEVMEESSVTVDGTTYSVPDPFLVIATENPIGSTGTQALPESQLDRFMICIIMGYPEKRDEISILMDQSTSRPLDHARKIMDRNDLLLIQEEVRNVFVHKVIYDYIVELSRNTRENDMLSLGLSVRGSLALTAMVKACAYMKGRDFVIPEDVEDVFIDVARHRVKLNSQAKMRQLTAQKILQNVLNTTQKPRPENRNEK